MFWLKFEELCKSIGTSPTAVSLSLVFSNATATKWKSGSIPSGKSLQKLADYFGVSIDYLLGKEKEPAKEIDELNEYLEELKNRSEMRMLFSTAKGASKEDIERAVAIIEALRQKEDG